MAATKACDAVYHVDPPPAAKKLRELFYSAFYVADHTVHFYILAAPDFVLGPDAPRSASPVRAAAVQEGVDTLVVARTLGRAATRLGNAGAGGAG